MIQVMLPAVLDEGRNRRGLSLTDSRSCRRAALRRSSASIRRKGSISVGADADLALWDLDREWEVSRAQLFSRHPWTPLEGRRIRGRVEATIRRGELVYRDGVVNGEPGSGRFLSSARPAARLRRSKQFRARRTRWSDASSTWQSQSKDVDAAVGEYERRLGVAEPRRVEWSEGKSKEAHFAFGEVEIQLCESTDPDGRFAQHIAR